MTPRRTCQIAALAALLAGAAEAGPWPRDEGGHFLSFSAERDRDGNLYAGVYGEYGASARTTLGYELGHTNVGETSLLVWLQRPLGRTDGTYRLTVAMGAGVIERAGSLAPVGLAAVAWGRGFEGPMGGGWFTAEARAKVAAVPDDAAAPSDAALAFLTPEMTLKADLTLGLRPRGGTMLIQQLRLEQQHDSDFSARLASSVVQDIGGPAKLELGVVLPLAGPGEKALKIGTWLEF